MDIEQELEVANKLVLAKVRRCLSPVEVSILSGSWQGQAYEGIASRRSHSNQTKNNAKKFADGMNSMNASISRVNQLKSALQRAWNRFGLASTAKGQMTNVISRIASG
jgi:hypothetical protein